jgi:hypothetical protein
MIALIRGAGVARRCRCGGEIVETAAAFPQKDAPRRPDLYPFPHGNA